MILPPRVSVILPVKNRGHLVIDAVTSLLRQNYPGEYEVIVIGDETDTTWPALAHIRDPRLRCIGVQAPVKRRDANYKRNVGALNASGTILAFTDSDGTAPSTWLDTGVRQLLRATRDDDGIQCVAGPIDSIGRGFWSRYVDSNVFGAKLPRIQEEYLTAAETFGMGGKKPPASGNLFVTRHAFMMAGGFCERQSRYEDYRFAWDLCRAGYKILHVRTQGMITAHRHRAGWGLFKEYLKAGEGCGQFIEECSDSPLATLRTNQLRQWQAAIVLSLALVLLVPFSYVPLLVATGIALTGLFALGVVEVWKIKRLEALIYPTLTLILGSVFTYGIAKYTDPQEPEIHLIPTRKREFA